jgi:hypothetical protein
MSRTNVPLAITAADIGILGWYCKTFHFNKRIYRYTFTQQIPIWSCSFAFYHVDGYVWTIAALPLTGPAEAGDRLDGAWPQ